MSLALIAYQMIIWAIPILLFFVLLSVDFTLDQHSPTEIPPSGQVSGVKRPFSLSQSQVSTLSTPTAINSAPYMKAVYKVLSTDLQYDIDETDYLSFLEKWKKVKGALYSKPDPLFDAWMLVSGRERDAFDENKFREMYPLVDLEVANVRELCRVRRFAGGSFSGTGWVYGGEDAQEPFNSNATED